MIAKQLFQQLPAIRFLSSCVLLRSSIQFVIRIKQQFLQVFIRLVISEVPLVGAQRKSQAVKRDPT